MSEKKYKSLVKIKKDGRLIRDERVRGKFMLHRNGFGFVTPLSVLENLKNPKDNIGKDIFVPADSTAFAMNGDIVEVKIQNRPGRARKEGVVMRILERAVKEVAGTFYARAKFGFVVPEGKGVDEDIYILPENFGGAKTGDRVAVEITSYPDENRSAEGRVTEIIGRKGEKGADIKTIARAKGKKFDYPEEAHKEAIGIASLASKNGVFSAKARKNDKWLDARRDLREKRIFTIDGASSKDFDDAVSVDILKNGNYLLGVHIADVSEYVKEGSLLDGEALERGCSVYLLDQVIPMLPFELSSGICSLNPGEDRLTLSVDMEIEPDGTIVDHEIYESVIRSCERMVYDDVSDMLDGAAERREKKTGSEKQVDDKRFESLKNRYKNIFDDIMTMGRLAEILAAKREKRGSIDFNVGEAEIILDENGHPSDIRPAARRCANRMIEEFMLSANETVAEHFYWQSAPFVYRIHETPAADKMQELRTFLRGFGIPMKGNPEKIHPLELAKILKRVAGTPHENVVGTVMLRSMQKAFYGTDCEGHFGLSLKYYCHFTSPIRRYPDLMIHRIIKEYLRQVPDERRIAKLAKAAERAAVYSSAAERKALEIEREVEKYKKCEYMEGFVGETFDGIVSGVNNFGMFVEFPNTVEGMVRVESMEDDFYDCEAEKYRLVGRGTGKIYALGQPVKVQVDYVNLERREIELKLIAEGKKKVGKRGKTNGNSGKAGGKRRKKK